jgi:hypothetical protein
MFNLNVLFLAGDPEDQTLRRVEREIVIPKIMRDKAKLSCVDEVAGIVLFII